MTDEKPRATFVKRDHDWQPGDRFVEQGGWNEFHHRMDPERRGTVVAVRTVMRPVKVVTLQWDGEERTWDRDAKYMSLREVSDD